MGLRNLTFPEVTVEIPGGDTFAVRGVTPDMAVGLYMRHPGELSALFDTIKSGDVGDVQVLLGTLVSAAPLIVAEIIALASGSDPNATHVDPDTSVNPLGLTDWNADVAAARKLSLPVQVDALTKIANQTFTSAMPPGKFLAVVIQMAATTTAALAPQRAL